MGKTVMHLPTLQRTYVHVSHTVYSVDEDPEIIGFLNVSIEALDVLTNLVKDR